MKKFTAVLCIVLAVVCGIAVLLAVSLAITGDQEDPNFSVFYAVVAVVFLALFALFTWAADHFGKFRQKQAQKKAQKEAEAQARQEAMDRARQDALDQARKEAMDQAAHKSQKVTQGTAQETAIEPVQNLMDLGKNIGAKFAIVSGLNLPAGIRCSVQLMGDHLSVRAQNQQFTLSNGKIVSVMVHTAKDIQQQYVSSIGGAVAGGLILGPLGMILGGMASKKTITNKTPLLIFAYLGDSGEVQYLIFNAEASPWTAQRFVRAYRGLTKSRTITTEL